MIETIDNRIRQIIADVLQLSVLPSGDVSSVQLEQWDSVSHLSLILALEQEFSVNFFPEEMERMESLGQIAEVLRKRGISQ